jgi:Mg2+-importing ATPase
MTGADLEHKHSGEPAAPHRPLESSARGLSQSEAISRLKQYGPNEFAAHRRGNAPRELLRLFLNPLVVILMVAAALSAAVGELANAIIIVVIVALNIVLNFSQLYRSQQALDALRRRVATTASCLRDGKTVEIPRSEVVPGDVVLIRAGDVVPADGRLLEGKELFVSEAALTGESAPVEKSVSADAMLAGSSVMSGSGMMEVTLTGTATQFGHVAAALAERPVETEFERGTKRFALLITRLVALLVAFVLAVNIVLDRGVLDSLLFAIALAIGLTPELLPMITSVTLAHGAQRMSKKRGC